MQEIAKCSNEKFEEVNKRLYKIEVTLARIAREVEVLRISNSMRST